MPDEDELYDVDGWLLFYAVVRIGLAAAALLFVGVAFSGPTRASRICTSSPSSRDLGQASVSFGRVVGPSRPWHWI